MAPLGRLARGLLVAVVAVVALPAPAFAHGGIDRDGYSNYRAELLAVEPARPDLTVRLFDVTGGIEVTYTGTEPLIVFGYDEDPFLPIYPDGVFANLNSSATSFNDRRDANVPVPDRGRTDSTPEWYRISAGHTARWHDHRLRWMGSAPRTSSPRHRAPPTLCSHAGAC